MPLFAELQRKGLVGVDPRHIQPFDVASFVDATQTDMIAETIIAAWLAHLSSSDTPLYCSIRSSKGGSDFIRWISSRQQLTRSIGSVVLFSHDHLLPHLADKRSKMVHFHGIPRAKESSGEPIFLHQVNLARRLSYDSLSSSIKALFHSEIQGYSPPSRLVKMCRNYEKDITVATIFTVEMLNEIRKSCFQKTSNHSRHGHSQLRRRDHPLRKAMGLGIFHGFLHTNEVTCAIVPSTFSEAHAEIPKEIVASIHLTTSSMSTSQKETVISLSALLSMLLISIRQSNSPKSVKELMIFVTKLEDEIKRLIGGHIKGPTSQLVSFDPCLNHQALPGEKISSVTCGFDCIQKGKSIIKTYGMLKTGVHLHLHGTENSKSDKVKQVQHEDEENGSGWCVPGEDSHDYNDETLGNWGYCYEERRIFEESLNNDQLILYSGGANIWISDPPIISVKNHDQNHHIVLLRDRFQPIYVTHVTILAAVEDMVKSKYSKDMISTFFVTQYSERQRSIADSYHEFAVFKNLHLDCLLTRAWEYEDVIRVISKRIHEDYRTETLQGLNLHFWISLSWNEFEDLLCTYEDPEDMLHFLKILTLNTKIRLHFAVCPRIESVQTSKQMSVYSKYVGKTSRVTRNETADMIKKRLQSQYATSGTCFDQCCALFEPISDDGTLYKQVTFPKYIPIK